MRSTALNPATKRVADTTEVSGRVTAQSIKYRLCTKKQSGLLRICALTILGCAGSVEVFAFLAPTPAQAQGIEEAIRHPRKPPPPTIPSQIAALKAEVATLQSQVQTLQTQIAALQSSTSGLGTLQAQMATIQANPALALGPFVSIDPNPEKGVIGPNITFKGANIHIVSGMGATDDNGTRSGLGNLIIGYDELFSGQVANRGGSHNLVVGRFNAFTSSAFGGLVAGEANTISSEATSVSGGNGNTASGLFAGVSGGAGNTASGLNSSVSGGELNTASGVVSSVLGGTLNTVSTDGDTFPP